MVVCRSRTGVVDTALRRYRPFAGSRWDLHDRQIEEAVVWVCSDKATFTHVVDGGYCAA
jgi:hypothetical protein